MAKVTWNGDKVARKVLAIAQDGIDETMAHCVEQAKTLVLVDTATLQGSLKFEPAIIQGLRAIGRWGSFDVNYAIFQEIGPVTGKRTWAFSPYLRPSADRWYPLLARTIRKYAERAGLTIKGTIRA